MDGLQQTRLFSKTERDAFDFKERLQLIYKALGEQGYDPLDQIVGYLLSGDPSYITAHGGARRLMGKMDREDLLTKMVDSYLESAASERGGPHGPFSN